MTDTFGKRLESRVVGRKKGRRSGVGLFQYEMQERAKRLAQHGEKLVGVTYPSIASYLKDKVAPPEEFVREAAAVLGVRVEWLATGEGAPTDNDRAIEQQLPADPEWRETAVSLKRAILGATTDDFIPVWVAPLMDATSRGGPIHRNAIAAAVNGPLSALDITPGEMDPRAFSNHVMRMIPVLLGITPQ